MINSKIRIPIKIKCYCIRKNWINYKIKFGENYTEFGFDKGDLYIVDYKLLNKCSLNVWNKLLKREHIKKDEIIMSDSDSEDIYTENELKFILKNKEEFK